MGLKELIQKYDVTGPRYTSYPTAPQWTDAFGETDFINELSKVSLGSPAAIYIHIPFCESLCLYCGCNIAITRDHGNASQYVETVLQEVRRVAKRLPKRIEISQVAWGGGTPTFLTEEEMAKLHLGVCDYFAIRKDAEISIEIDPRVTSFAQLARLRNLGFNRVSLGVQDFDPAVQKAIHRIQPAQATLGMRSKCRNLGFSGVNYDLIYGLPCQTLESFSQTLGEVLRHRPDRIALYNYAHLPSLRPHQGALERYALPTAVLKTQIFELAYEVLLAAGYIAVGMDHFALATDELCRALANGSLYRNFQGYTVKRGLPLFGFGASAISEFDRAYFQNVREVKAYSEKIRSGGLAVQRGKALSEDDARRKWVIGSLMCRFRVSSNDYSLAFGRDLWDDFEETRHTLYRLQSDEILELDDSGISVTEIGRLFVRNAAMAFDGYLTLSSPPTYSKTL